MTLAEVRGHYRLGGAFLLAVSAARQLPDSVGTDLLVPAWRLAQSTMPMKLWTWSVRLAARLEAWQPARTFVGSQEECQDREPSPDSAAVLQPSGSEIRS